MLYPPIPLNSFKELFAEEEKLHMEIWDKYRKEKEKYYNDKKRELKIKYKKW